MTIPVQKPPSAHIEKFRHYPLPIINYQLKKLAQHLGTTYFAGYPTIFLILLAILEMIKGFENCSRSITLSAKASRIIIDG